MTPGKDGKCGGCTENEVMYDGNCVCKDGYIHNELKICTRCDLVTGAFMVDEKCALCPGDLIYINDKCACPEANTKIGVKCYKTCKNDELIDENGLCYSCPIYEVITKGKC